MGLSLSLTFEFVFEFALVLELYLLVPIGTSFVGKVRSLAYAHFRFRLVSNNNARCTLFPLIRYTKVTNGAVSIKGDSAIRCSFTVFFITGALKGTGRSWAETPLKTSSNSNSKKIGFMVVGLVFSKRGARPISKEKLDKQ